VTHGFAQSICVTPKCGIKRSMFTIRLFSSDGSRSNRAGQVIWRNRRLCSGRKWSARSLLCAHTLRALALTHRRHPQNFTWASQHTFGGAGDGHQPVVIATSGNKLQADRHAEAIKAYGQRRRAQI
jgi:hypothetical protein